MKKGTRILTIMLALLFFIGSMPAMGYAENDIIEVGEDDDIIDMDDVVRFPEREGKIVNFNSIQNEFGEISWHLNDQGQMYLHGEGSWDINELSDTINAQVRELIIVGDIRFISNGCFSSFTNLKKITIENSELVIDGNDLSFSSNLESIEVDPSVLEYSSVDGVLFNSDKTSLIAYPQGKGTSYVIPDGVTTIGYAAFVNNEKLETVTIPASVSGFEVDAFAFCSNLKTINFEGHMPIIIGDEDDSDEPYDDD